jgi:hypothetical protein
MSLGNQADLHNVISAAVAVDTTAISADGNTAGNIIDMADTLAIEFVLQTGAVTAGNVTMLVEEGDESDLSDAATVPATNLLGTAATVTAANTIDRVGYLKRRRYVRVTLVAAGTANLTAGVVAVKLPALSE